MAAMVFDEQVYNREVPFCKVYSKESKDKLEKIFLQNRISYFIEWQQRSWLSRLFGESKKISFTIRINEADVDRATALVQGIEAVKLKKQKEIREE